MSLRYYLGPSYDFTFLNGAHPWPAAPAVKAYFGAERAEACYSYFDGTAPSAAASVRDLASYLCENGPFDCVLGFSLGASLVATLLLIDPAVDPDPALQRAKTMVIKAAVFICRIAPCNWTSLAGRGETRELGPGDVSADEKIRISTVHAWSSEDKEYPGHDEMLLSMCAESTRTEIVHTAGHGVPRNADEVSVLARAIKDVVEGASPGT